MSIFKFSSKSSNCWLIVRQPKHFKIWSPRNYTTETVPQGPNPLQCHKSRAAGFTTKYFVDSRKIVCLGGRGGDACVSSYQSWRDGGNGGSVILEASNEIQSLSDIKHRRYDGGRGEHAKGDRSSAMQGEDLIVKVPVGIEIKELPSGRPVASMDLEGMKFIAAKGGPGGQASGFEAKKNPELSKGKKGEYRKLSLEMKQMAHAGLIGFPNVGKSTFLRAISRARPKVANYPFTTLQPHIGIVAYDDYTQLAIADLPGLIPGSHLNRGFGIEFLKHVARCLCLIYVIDISQTDPSPINQFDTLRYELEQFKTGLSTRPQVVICNKIDLDGAADQFENFRKVLEEREEGFVLCPLSAKNGKNIVAILKYIKQLYDEQQNQPQEPEPDDQT